MGTFWLDVRSGVRAVVRRPLFSAVVILTVALGIGGNAAIFGLLNGIFLRPFPFGDADRLVRLSGFDRERGFDNMSVSVPDFVDWREQSQTLERVVAFDGASFNLASGERPERISGARVSAGLFEAFGVVPIHGRTFRPDDERPGAPQVVILGEGLWQRRFGGDAGLVGDEIRLDGRPHTVVGIVPAGFEFPIREEIWVPLAVDPGQTDRRSRSLGVLALPRPGVGIDAVRGEIEAIAARLAESYPEANRGIGVEVVPFRDFYVARGRTLFLLLQGAVLFVLLIACTNVANLILARGAAREGELAVRTAIGAGRFQIVRQLLSESLTLAIAGGALGLLLAHWGIGILVRAIPVDLPFWIRVGIDGRVVAFVIILSIATGFLFGLLPALRNSRVDLTSSLKEGGRKGAGLRRRRLFKSTVVAEVALTIILLICAGLMIESFLRLQRVDPGLEPEGVLTARVSDLPEASYPEDHQVVSFYSRLTEELEVVPGVEAVGADSRLPLRGQAGSERIFNVEDRPELAAGESLPFANFQVVTPGYFRTLGVPVLEGRAFEEQDDATGRPVAIVNRKLAEQIWPGERAVGKRIRFGTTADQQPWMTVVGVAGDVRHRGLDQELMLDLYVPLRQYPVRSMTLVMRTAFQPDDVAPAIREAVLRLDPELPIYDVMSMDQVVSESLWLQRFSAYLLLVLGGVALVLAAVGLYGVVAYFVTERVHEIGIRMSLGASRSTVIRLVLRQSLILVLAGVVLGLPLAALLNRGLASVLYGVGALELVPIVGISVLLVVVAVVAAFLPARRATRVDPAVSLRYQ